MTEQEWLVSNDPARMLQWAMRGRGEQTACKDISNRKLRLFVVACWWANPRREEFYSREAYETAEAADGLTGFDAADLAQAWTTLLDNSSDPSPLQKAALLRDIIGNPWRRYMRNGDGIIGRVDGVNVVEQFRVTPTVLSLAQAAYEKRGRRWGCERRAKRK